jgi:hypothetical protein
MGDNIKHDLKEYDISVNWIQIAERRHLWQFLVRMVIKLGSFIQSEELLEKLGDSEVFTNKALLNLQLVP